MHWRHAGGCGECGRQVAAVCGRCDGKCREEKKEKEKERVLVRKEVKSTQYMYHSQDGKIPPDSAVGRLLMETVSMVPQIDSSQFEQIMNSAMQVLA